MGFFHFGLTTESEIGGQTESGGHYSAWPPITTFDPADAEGNVKALDRMASLAGAPGRVVPGHDPFIFKRFPTKGRIAKIK